MSLRLNPSPSVEARRKRRVIVEENVFFRSLEQDIPLYSPIPLSPVTGWSGGAFKRMEIPASDTMNPGLQGVEDGVSS
jgi:hypothetical protein